jgi:dTDP-4-dehydrorhamnose reductase
MPDWRVIGLERSGLDLLDWRAVNERFEREQPGLVIHCAALSKSPACQANPLLARKINVEATARLAELACSIPFIFLSTDLVFDGRGGDYREEDPVNPLSVYAETKAEAEAAILSNPLHTVVRTSLNGGVSPTRDRGFNEEMQGAWKEGKTLTLFTDEFRCPIPALVTARGLWEMAAKRMTGLYHLAGSEKLSRWEIGRLLASRHAELNPRIQPGSLKNYAGPPRSPDTSLNCEKLAGELSFPLPGLTSWLAQHPREWF